LPAAKAQPWASHTSLEGFSLPSGTKPHIASQDASTANPRPSPSHARRARRQENQRIARGDINKPFAPPPSVRPPSPPPHPHSSPAKRPRLAHSPHSPHPTAPYRSSRAADQPAVVVCQTAALWAALRLEAAGEADDPTDDEATLLRIAANSCSEALHQWDDVVRHAAIGIRSTNWDSKTCGTMVGMSLSQRVRDLATCCTIPGARRTCPLAQWTDTVASSSPDHLPSFRRLIRDGYPIATNGPRSITPPRPSALIVPDSLPFGSRPSIIPSAPQAATGAHGSLRVSDSLVVDSLPLVATLAGAISPTITHSLHPSDPPMPLDPVPIGV
jgi:hypothetical protein